MSASWPLGHAILLRDRRSLRRPKRAYHVEKLSRMSGRCDVSSYVTLHRSAQKLGSWTKRAVGFLSVPDTTT